MLRGWARSSRRLREDEMPRPWPPGMLLDSNSQEGTFGTSSRRPDACSHRLQRHTPNPTISRSGCLNGMMFDAAGRAAAF